MLSRPGVLVSVIVVLWISGLLRWMNDSVFLTLGYFGADVERVVFLERFSSYRSVAEMRHPIILTDTVAEQWKARRKWNTRFLARVVRHGSVYSQTSNPDFLTFHDNRTLEPIVTQRWQDFNVKSKQSISQVLHRSENDIYHYFSEGIQDIQKQYPEAMTDIEPFSDLILTPKNVQINVWIGRPGIVTHTHYDATYNFFVQLQGRKRFTLFPPSSELYLYPCLHPHYGHSQVDVKNPNYTLYPDLDQSRAMVAELRAGDMLVVPPFWYHHVETLAESVSVNVWSIAEELGLMDTIYEQAVPFEDDWDVRTMIGACRVYFEMIAGDIQVLFSDVWTSISLKRYKPLIDSAQLDVREDIRADVRIICQELDLQKLRQQWKDKFALGVQMVAPYFLQMTDTAIRSRAVRSLSLANYMEHVVAAVMPVSHIAPFFMGCLV